MEPLGYVSKLRPRTSPRRRAIMWACACGKTKYAVRRPACSRCRSRMSPAGEA